METGKTKPLHYKRVIWLKDNQQLPESIQLIYNLLKDNTYTFKQFDIVLDISELVDLRHTKTVYEYFEQLKSKDEGTKTLCIINHESETMIPRDILLSRVTRMWTSFSTAYVNYNNDHNISCNRSFNYIIGTDKLVERLSYIIQTGR
jgi:hypothetical protein